MLHLAGDANNMADATEDGLLGDQLDLFASIWQPAADQGVQRAAIAGLGDDHLLEAIDGQASLANQVWVDAPLGRGAQETPERLRTGHEVRDSQRVALLRGLEEPAGRHGVDPQRARQPLWPVGSAGDRIEDPCEGRREVATDIHDQVLDRITWF